jgi:hypothetical protein
VDGGKDAVDSTALTRATQWAEYLESHARRIYAITEDGGLSGAHRLAGRLLDRDLRDGFSARQVYRKGWEGRANRDTATEAIEYLVDLGWLRTEASQNPKGGAPLVTYSINPKTFNLTTDGTDRTDKTPADPGFVSSDSSVRIAFNNSVIEWIEAMRVSQSHVYKRLVALGFVVDIAIESVTDTENVPVGDFANEFIRSHEGAVKEATVITWRQTKRLLIEFFGADKPITEITVGDARDFRNYLKTRTGETAYKREAKPLSEATVRRRCLCAKQMFAYAIDKGYMPVNPFHSKSIPTVSPRSATKQFIDHGLCIRIMEFIDEDWLQLVFALGRWGGMACRL